MSANSDDILSSLPEPAERPHEFEHSLHLLAKAQQGDRLALEQLVQRYHERIRRIARVQLGGSTLRRDMDSMDVVQSTFQAALPRIRELRPENASSLLRWLALIATNQIRDAHDRRNTLKRGGTREVGLDSENGNVGEALVARDDRDPLERLQLEEVRELLDAVVARLPDDQRRVVLLRDYCGESWERIAEELVRENGAVRQLHQRAWIGLRRTLRPKLEGRE